MQPELIRPGDKIKLTDYARDWTHGLTFEVDEVRPWGVVCFVRLDKRSRNDGR